MCTFLEDVYSRLDHWGILDIPILSNIFMFFYGWWYGVLVCGW